jgi:hypothetical protein
VQPIWQVPPSPRQVTFPPHELAVEQAMLLWADTVVTVLEHAPLPVQVTAQDPASHATGP